MIHVIATITVKPCCKAKFLDIFKQNVPKVLAEEGCIRYEPTLDADSGLPVQVGPRDNAVTIVEAWESLEHLFAHLKAPHMVAYKEQTKDLTEGVSLQVLQPAG